MAKTTANAKRTSGAQDDDVDMTIDAMPTKELFIDMLTRDIALIPAIIDLVDNSADAARKAKGDGSLKGNWTRVQITGNDFSITDNCGGMSIEVARKYAFRFGRPAGAPSVKHSVGQFGVGMKRAIFKIGRKFKVVSTTRTSQFVMEINVDDWAREPKWEFEFTELVEDEKQDDDLIGTSITVSNLRTDVSEKFRLEYFRTELKNELQSKLQDPLSRGLAITLNGLPIDSEPLTILSDPKLAPAHKILTYPEAKKKTVTVNLFCGIGRSTSRKDERDEAGWHVFCNGRLILEGDKTEVTGWDSKAEGLSIPGFHGQYNNLRGFAYFDCDDPARLPWNTTKTGLNTDSTVYRSAKLEMMLLMRPVIDFLNRLKEEKKSKEDSDEIGPLQKMMEAAKAVELNDAKTRSAFSAPTVASPSKNTGPVMQKIQYVVPLSQVNEVMQELGVNSYKDVGKGTFEYFYRAEVDN